mgnify:CR=1 FL=1
MSALGARQFGEIAGARCETTFARCTVQTQIAFLHQDHYDHPTPKSAGILVSREIAVSGQSRPGDDRASSVRKPLPSGGALPRPVFRNPALSELSLINENPSWIRDVRATLRNSDVDFFRTRPWRYWLDFIVSATAAYVAAGIYLVAPLFSPAQIIAFPLAVFLLYRSGSLIHEVAHLPRNELRAFKLAWNLVVGVITLAPSTFFTSHHRDHHSGKFYGTRQDPEYVVNVFRRGSFLGVLAYGLHIILFPAFVFLRFLLAPLSFVHPKVRDFTLRRLSSFTLNWKYEKKISRLDHKSFVAIEMLCWARASMILIAVAVGLTLWTRIPLMYFLAASTLLLNQMRQLADHHFESDGKSMSVSDHIMDSCNHTERDFLTWVFFPFAIKFHALHHLFPSLPYHNLRAAHLHLAHELPADSPYHQLSQPTWWSAAKVTLGKK